MSSCDFLDLSVPAEKWRCATWRTELKLVEKHPSQPPKSALDQFGLEALLARSEVWALVLYSGYSLVGRLGLSD